MLNNKEKVYDFLKNNPGQYSAQKIAKLLYINNNTTRGILRGLTKEGLIKDQNHFYFVEPNNTNESSDGLRLGTQNIDFVFEKNSNVIFKERKNIQEEIFDQRIHITIGKGSQKATMNIGAEKNIRLELLLALGERFKSLILLESGYFPKDQEIRIKKIEFNQDIRNLRFEGITCMTLTDAVGLFKLYNKQNPLRIRPEYRPQINVGLDEIKSLLKLGPIESNNRFYLDKKFLDLETKLDEKFKQTMSTIFRLSDKIS